MPKTYLSLVLCYLFLGSLKVNSLPCEDAQCRTGSCNSDGDCQCRYPDNSTILDGDRIFLGGRFCDEEMVMCDGTSSFWCQHGGKCEEIIQGESYRCKCPLGYAGDHCEYSGVQCGDIFCFHGAACSAEKEACECPSAWRGSVDCSLPTKSTQESLSSKSSTRLPGRDDDSGTSGFMLFMVIICVLGAVVGATIYAKKWIMRKERAATKSLQLSNRPPYHVLEEDDTNHLVSADATLDDDSHL